jgi:hypothetical protein
MRSAPGLMFALRLLAIVLMIAGTTAAHPQSAVEPAPMDIAADDCCRSSSVPAGHEDEDQPRPCRKCSAVCCAGITAVLINHAFAHAVEMRQVVECAAAQSDRCSFVEPLLDPPRA